MDIKLQEIIQEAKSEPVLVRICQVLESMLVDFNQKEKDARITELEEKVSNFEKGYGSDMTVVQNELHELKERMLNTEMYNSKETEIVNNPLNVKMEILEQFFHYSTPICNLSFPLVV